MNGMYGNIPEGTRDILYGEAETLAGLERTLCGLFEREGFSREFTPALEYYDTFERAGQALPQEAMFKLTDSSGRLLVLRADNTTPTARVAAAKLRGRSLRLYYCQSVFRVNHDYSGKRSEVLESGIELIGSGRKQADVFSIRLAVKTLEKIAQTEQAAGGESNFVLEIGHAGFCGALINGLGLPEEKARAVRRYINSKNAVSLGFETDSAEMEKIRLLPTLYGGEEVLEKAQRIAEGNAEAEDALAYLRGVYDEIKGAGLAKHVMIDLGIVHALDYYTGIVFRGYTEGAGEPVLLGGRYDNLGKSFDNDLPAIGFAVNLCLAADAIRRVCGEKKPKTADVLIFCRDGELAEADRLKDDFEKQGVFAVLSCSESPEEALEYAKSAGIMRVTDTAGKDIK